MKITLFFKKNTPKFYKLVRTLLWSKRDLQFQKSEIEKRNLIEKILKNVFKNYLAVRSGPFKGMLYIDTSCGSALFPKILGTYEEPIQKWIAEAIEKKYSTIVDIGSAEGYYSTGFAIKAKDAKIFAFDINQQAILENKKLSKINSVDGKIVFENNCDGDILKKIIDDKTLIICDIEGHESKLLNPKKFLN